MLNATGVGGFAFADNIFYRENTLTFFKTQVERFSQQSIESLGGWFFYHFLRGVFSKPECWKPRRFYHPERWLNEFLAPV